MRRALILLGAALLWPQLAHATTYYFSTAGSDAFDGLSESAPKLSLNWIQAVLTPGNSVFLKRGDTWYEDSLNWNFSNQAGSAAFPMVLGAYGTGARPIVANMNTATWVKGPGDVYKGRRPWARPAADSIGQVFRFYLAGTPLPRASGPDSLGDSTYCVSADSIYVRCDACDSSATFEYSRCVTGYLLSARNTSYLTISDLELKGGAAWAALLFEAPTSHISIVNVNLHQFLSYGIEFATPNNYATTTDKNDNIAILNCTIDKGWSPRMNHERTYRVYDAWNKREDTKGANDAQPGGDGINLNNAIDGAIVRGCYVTNMGHSGIQNELRNPDNFGTRDILFEQNVITAGTSSYCRGLALGGDQRCVHNVVRRNYVHDANIQSQFGGESTYVYSNIFEHTSVTPVRRAAAAMSSYIVPETGVSPYIARNMVFANNTISGADAGLRITSSPNDTGMVLNNRFANNLVLDWKTILCWWNNSNVELNAAVVADSTPTAMANWSFQNNGFWKSGSDGVVLVIARSTWLDQYAAPMLNARPKSSGNLYGDPALATGDSTAGFALTANSPYVSSGTSLAPLLPAGMEAVDYYGRPFGVTASIGAIQYAFTRSDSVSVSGVPTGAVKLNTVLSLTAVLHPGNSDIKSYAWRVRNDASVVMTSSLPTLAETLSVAGTYTISLAVTDKLGYVHAAAIAIVTAYSDTIPPASVGGLAMDPSMLYMAISWIVPGDDGITGTAAESDLRYSTSPITTDNFLSATRISTTPPGGSGTAECLIKDGLSSCTTYYLALKTADAAGNWSKISNFPAAETSCSQDFPIICGAGYRLLPFGIESIPTAMELQAPRPNPAFGIVRLEYGVPASESGKNYEITVFDVLGRRIVTLASGAARPGRFSAEWRPDLAEGGRVGPGVYFVRFRLDRQVQTRTVVKVR